MRLSFLFLLLANVLLFGWAAGYWDGAAGRGERERLHGEIDAERLRLISASPPPAVVCRRIAWLTAAEAETVRSTIGNLSDWQLAVRAAPAEKQHWVVIAELKGQALAERKLREATALGAENGSIVEDAQDGPYLVRFGVFPDSAAAEALHQSLTGQGVRSARLLKREVAGNTHAIELRAKAADLREKLPALLALLPQAREADCVQP